MNRTETLMRSERERARRGGWVPLNIGLGEEWVPPNEAADIARMLALHGDVQERSDRTRAPVPRGQHPKQHGCVFAQVVVSADVPPDLRFGILAAPRTYSAVVRFSNARQHHDQLPDAHGMAIKVLGVEGTRLMEDDSSSTTQDLVLVDHPVFFMRNVAEGVPLLEVFHALKTGDVVAKSRAVLRGLFSQAHAFQIIRRMATKRPASVLATRYWSTTPFRVGPLAVKWSLVPRLAADAVRRCSGRDRYRESMMHQLERGAVEFDLMVQRQVHPVTTPVEDPTVEWDESEAPFVTVATVHLPSQRFATPERLAFGEHLSFTPWHGIDAHRPLGGINRARRAIYRALADRRRALNQVAAREPTLGEVEALWAGDRW